MDPTQSLAPQPCLPHAGEGGQGAVPLPKLETRDPEPTSVFVRDNAYRAGREALSLAAVLVMVAVVAAAFVWPWLPQTPPGSADLARYAPVRDGDARLMLQTLGDGSTKGWLAHNVRLIPGLRVATDARKAVTDAFLEALREPGETMLGDDVFRARLTGLTIIETRSHEVDAEGKVTETWQYVARDRHGDRFVAISYPQLDRDIVLRPPAMMLPAGLEVGASWLSEGSLGNTTYIWRGRVLSQGRYDGAAGAFDDCLQIESQFIIASAGDDAPSLTRDWYCAGLGWVEAHSLASTGELLHRTAWLGADGALPEDAPLPPVAPQVVEAPEMPSADRWRLTRLGRVRPTGETTESSILPTWIPSDPPLVLAAGFASDLVAFETYLPGAPARWRFHVDGVVYGQPAFDSATGRIFVGASDKRLCALDTRGLFLWSFQTEDNVAARPLIVGDVVIAAGEDGKVYGLEAASGRQRWLFEAAASVVSWPALADGVVVVGSDAGEVVGLDAGTGEQRWTFAAADAVEAPIVVSEDGAVVFVASRDGTLAAFRPAGCTGGACASDWAAEAGGSLRTGPLVADDRVVVVDEDGQLIAFSAEDGRRIWAVGGAGYVGAPVLADGAIVVATSKGVVERVDLDGHRLDRWDARTATSPADKEPSFAYGPVVGGDALWIGDGGGVIRRLGAPPLGEIPALHLAWFVQTGRPPFNANQLRNTALAYGGKALLLDYQKGVYLVDPATGEGVKVTQLPGDGLLAQIDPVLSGDTLLTVAGSTVQALDLRTGQLRWQGAANGTTVRPPVVVGQTVLWLTGAGATPTLLALDLQSGAMRWQSALAHVTQPGGVVAGADAAFTSTPPAAWDLQTGQLRWQATVGGATIGGPGLAPDGQTAYVSGVRADGSDGMVVALDAQTGAVRWQVDVADGLIHPLDRLWVVDGLVVIPALNGRIIALDAVSGAERWRFEPPISRLGGITVERNRVWFMLENARLYGLDLQSGRPVARLTELELALSGMGLTQRPALIGDRIIFPAGLSLIGLDLPEDAP